MNVPVEYAMGTVRLSVGRTTTPQEIAQTIETFKEGVRS
jgi:cysteine sulfinate desulfinase/cysteine desulfurase-like protein